MNVLIVIALVDKLTPALCSALTTGSKISSGIGYLMSNIIPLNVAIINYPNVYLSSGIAELLSQVTGRPVMVVHANGNEMDDMAKADIIFINATCGQNFLCYPIYKIRKYKSLVIGIIGHNRSPSEITPSYCLHGMKYLSLQTSVEALCTLFSQGLSRLSNQDESGFFHHPQFCYSCNKIELSLQQLHFGQLFLSGENMTTIARVLNCKVKTAYSHKAKIMKNFHIKTDQELYVLLERRLLDITVNNIYPGINI